jgi:sulfite reductase (NADPH) hemoprotein beta-component
LAAKLGEIKQMVTGNRLRDGIPVYYTGHAHWSPAITEAVVAAADQGDRLLAEALAGPQPHPVVAPYLVDVIVTDGVAQPASLRERIRAFGPTTFRDDRRVSAA